MYLYTESIVSYNFKFYFGRVVVKLISISKNVIFLYFVWTKIVLKRFRNVVLFYWQIKLKLSQNLNWNVYLTKKIFRLSPCPWWKTLTVYHGFTERKKPLKTLHINENTDAFENWISAALIFMKESPHVPLRSLSVCDLNSS